MAESIYKMFDYESPQAIKRNYLDSILPRSTGGDLYSQLAQAGNTTGGLLGYALGGLAGYKPAGMQKAETMDQITAEAAKGANPLAQATKAYELFAANGMGREAQVAMERIDELKKEQDALKQTAALADVDFTKSASVLQAAKAALQSGDRAGGISLLKEYQQVKKEEEKVVERNAVVGRRKLGIKAKDKNMPEDVLNLVSQDEVVYEKWADTLFEAQKNNYDISYQTFDGQRVMVATDKDTATIVKKIPLGQAAQTGTTVEVNTGNLENAVQTAKGKVLGTGIGEDLLKTRLAAQTANENLPKMYTALNILETQPITTGLGSAFYDILNQVRAQYLSDKEAGNIVQNDQYLDSLVGGDVFNAIADLGIGARGIDTPKEKDFLLEVVTGKRSLSKGALIEITKMRIENTEKSVNRFNDYLSKGDYADFEKGLGRKLSPIQLRSANKALTSSNW